MSSKISTQKYTPRYTAIELWPSLSVFRYPVRVLYLLLYKSTCAAFIFINAFFMTRRKRFRNQMEIWVLPLCTRLRVVRYPNSQFMTFKRVQYNAIDDVYLFNMFTINYLVSNIIRYLNSKISTQKHAHRYMAIELWPSPYTFRYPLRVIFLLLYKNTCATFTPRSSIFEYCG